MSNNIYFYKIILCTCKEDILTKRKTESFKKYLFKKKLKNAKKLFFNLIAMKNMTARNRIYFKKYFLLK